MQWFGGVGMVAIAAILAVSLVVVVVVLATRGGGDERSEEVIAAEAGESLGQCAGVGPADLPELPSKLRYAPIDVPREQQEAAEAEGAVVRRLLENGRPVGTVLSTSLALQAATGEQLLSDAERGLRQAGATPRRIDLGPYGAVIARLSEGRHQVITRGECRSYSVLGSSDRSVRGMALALLRAESSTVTGLAPAAPSPSG